MKVVALFMLLFSLASCADWPVVKTPRADAAWPELVPISSLPKSQSADSEVQANEQLLNRAAALRARAAIMRRPVPNNDTFEQMRSRLGR